MSDRLALSSLISYPKEVRRGGSYLITVDVEHCGDAWSYEAEELSLRCLIDAAPELRTRAVGSNVLVVHRFGGAYRPIVFAVDVQPDFESGWIRVTFVNEADVAVHVREVGPIDVAHFAEAETRAKFLALLAQPLRGVLGLLSARSVAYDEKATERREAHATPEPLRASPTPLARTPRAPIPPIASRFQSHRGNSMRICVVGGGPAGLAMAYFLEQAGYHNVVVFERDDHVGGKCWTIPMDGFAYDMGAVEVTKEYKLVNALIEHFDLPLSEVPDGRILDRASGDTRSLLALYEGESKVELLAQIANFTFELRRLLPYLDVPGFARMPDSLKGISFSQWLHQIGAPLLERFFWMPLTCCGYGPLDAIPAVYALKFATVMPFHVLAHRFGLQELLPDDLRFLEPLVHRLTHGFQSLMESIAASFTVPPVVNARIVSIDRSTPNIMVRYSVGQDPAVREATFDRIVITIPQTLANLAFLQLTTKEKDLFAQVSTIPYYTTLTSPKTFQSKFYYELADKAAGALGPPPLPHVLQFARCWPQALGAVFYTGAAPGDWRPLEGGPGSIESIVTSAIVNANQKPGSTMTSLEWKFFPQVPQAAIDAGFYDDLENMQGLHGTYYAGGLLNFELVEKAMEYSKALVRRFFAEVPVAR